MRPLILKLQGIGSYRSEQIIDFSHYDDFFLIAGDTGSGKTTIFDAMMFSLYGEVAGTRSGDDLVHAGLDYDAVPYCEFSFILSGKKFSIKRIPAYDRKKKKGEGFTSQPETVVLKEFKNSEWIEHNGKKTDIDGKILSMLRFSADEFSKLILLPQGEFEKFLISETKEKRELLEKIFPVDIYKKCSERFNTLKNDLASEKKQISKNLNEKLKSFDPQKYTSDLQELKESRTEIISAINKLNIESKEKAVEISGAEKILKMFSEMEQKKSELDRLLNLKNDIEETETGLQNYRLFLKHKPLIEKFDYISENVEKSTNLISDLENTLLNTETEFQKLSNNYEKLPIWRKEINFRESGLERLEALIPEIKNCKNIDNDLQKSSENFEKYEKEKQDLLIKLNEIDIKLNTITEFKNQHKDINEKNIALNDKINQLDRKCSEYELSNQQKVKASRLRDEIENHEKNLVKVIALLEKINHEIDDCKKNDELFYLNKISENLKENEPCPVCGSVDHPAIFKSDKILIHDLIRSEQLESDRNEKTQIKLSIEKEIEMKKSNLNEICVLFDEKTDYEVEQKNLSNSILELKEIYQNNLNISEKLTKNENNFSEQLNLKDRYNERITFLNSQINELKIKISENSSFIKNISEKFNELKITLSKTSEYFSKISDQLSIDNDLQMVISELKNSIINGNAKVSDIEKQYIAENEKRIKIKSDIEGHKKNIVSSDSELKSLHVQLKEVLKTEKLKSAEELRNFMLTDVKVRENEKKIENYKLAVVQNRESLKYFEDNLKDVKKPDISELQAELKAIEKTLNELADKRDSISEKITLLQKSSSEYESLIREQNILNEKFSEVEKMAQILNGTNSRNMTFQDYVLAGYMQEVLNSANKRLIKISDGQYQLKRRNAKEKGSTKSGLEFNVIDVFNGVEREVQSLSGGEKFLTSLCLALGLSDVIQNRSGGTELEALFIDEGFGSLDELSLERAISVLDEIRGTRMVGIISHVKELKNRIPSIITVRKTLDGSQIINN